MSSFNQVTLIGHLGADPEFRVLNSGTRVCNMRIATSERWKDKNTGEKKEQTDWHTVVSYNDNLNKIIEQYVAKGSKILVQGQLKTRSWEKDGDKRYATEVVIQAFGGTITLLDSKGSGGGGGRDEERYGAYDRNSGTGGGSGFSGQDSRGNPQQQDFSADLDEEIPF